MGTFQARQSAVTGWLTATAILLTFGLAFQSPALLAQPNQLYVEDNTFTGAGINQIYFTDDHRHQQFHDADAIGDCGAVENRDFYTQRSGTFDGTGSAANGGGVGRGVRSSRPSICTTGVAYWATDGGTNWNTSNGGGVDGGLDKCTATNTWTNDWYKQYTYPHPLTLP